MLISYKHLTHGLTNESYHLKFSKDEYVIKFFNHEAIDLGIDHKKEMRILGRLEELNIAPIIIYIDLDEEFSIARWIDGQYWSHDDFDDDVHIHQLMSRIKELHSVDTEGLHHQDLITCIQAYRDKLDVNSVAPQLMRQRLLDRAIEIITASEDLVAPCLCHNDLLHTNILKNDGLHFFDWEFAGVNSPLFELAVLCVANNLNTTQEEKVLQGYFGDRWQDFVTPLSEWKWVYEYIALLWELAVQKEVEEVSAAQQRRLNDLLA
jgi:thiamine kinase-like enzyme